LFVVALKKEVGLRRRDAAATTNRKIRLFIVAYQVSNRPLAHRHLFAAWGFVFTLSRHRLWGWVCGGTTNAALGWGHAWSRQFECQ